MSELIKLSDLEIDFKKSLGKGYIAEVFKARHKFTNKFYAVKVKAFKEEKVALQREIQIQKKLQHPNIIRLYSAEEKDNKLYIILEYMSRGTLFNYLMEQKEGFSEEQALDYFKQMLKAMNYLHQNKILHRDLKPENILMGENGQIKLCDFGFTAIFGDQIRVTKCGTREYMAPEMFQNQQQDDGVDIWSLGILLFELTHKSTPFPLNILFDFQRHYRRFKIPFKKNLSPQVKDLISKILQYNPKKRPTANQILDLPLLKNIKEENHDQYQQKNGFKNSQKQIQNSVKVQQTYQSSGQIAPLVSDNQTKFQDYYRNVTQQINTTTQQQQQNNKPLFNIQKYQQSYQNSNVTKFNEYGVKKPTESNSRIISSTKNYQRNYTPVPHTVNNNYHKSTSIQQKFGFRDNSAHKVYLNPNLVVQSNSGSKLNFANSHSGKFYNYKSQKQPIQQINSYTNMKTVEQNLYQNQQYAKLSGNSYQENQNNIYNRFQNPVQISTNYSHKILLKEEQPIQYKQDVVQTNLISHTIANNQIDQPNKQINFQIPFKNHDYSQGNYIRGIKRSYQPPGNTNGVRNTSDFPLYKNIVPSNSQHVGLSQNIYRQTDLTKRYQSDLQTRINNIRQHSESRQKVKKISLHDFL